MSFLVETRLGCNIAGMACFPPYSDQDTIRDTCIKKKQDHLWLFRGNYIYAQTILINLAPSQLSWLTFFQQNDLVLWEQKMTPAHGGEPTTLFAIDVEKYKAFLETL
jgi:hypothetical protein